MCSVDDSRHELFCQSFPHCSLFQPLGSDFHTTCDIVRHTAPSCTSQVHVEVPVERTVFREVPVPVYGEERVIVKEVTVPVEVIREVAVPVEHVVTKEVHVPVEIGMRSETRVGESRVVIGEETRSSPVLDVPAKV